MELSARPRGRLPASRAMVDLASIIALSAPIVLLVVVSIAIPVYDRRVRRATKRRAGEALASLEGDLAPLDLALMCARDAYLDARAAEHEGDRESAQAGYRQVLVICQTARAGLRAGGEARRPG